MGVSTSVYIGTYLVCTQSLDPHATTTVAACSKTKKHQVNAHDKFCPHCGAPVKVTEEPVKEYVSFLDWVYENLILPVADQEFLNEAGFEAIHDEWVGWRKEGKELVGFNMVHVDCDNEGVHEEPSFEFPRAVPTAEQIDELKRIFGYTNVEVKFGTLVFVA